MARRFTPALSARLFTLFTGAVVVFQLALLAGAPWGALTQGGRTSGVLPDGARAVAAFSAVLLMAFILVVRAGPGCVCHVGVAHRSVHLGCCGLRRDWYRGQCHHAQRARAHDLVARGGRDVLHERSCGASALGATIQ